MRVDTHRKYNKAWARLTAKQQTRVREALKVFVTDPTDSRLRSHQLQGKYFPQYSISVGGDLRVHYLALGPNWVVLTMVGTHSQLYE